MCKVYNTIGSLTTLKSHLECNNIHDFKSIKDLINFQRSYSTHRQELISNHENLVEQERNTLNTELQELGIEIKAKRQQSEQRLTFEIEQLKQQLDIATNSSPSNIFQKLKKTISQWNYKREIKTKENNFDFEIENSITELNNIYQLKNSRYEFVSTQFNEAVRQSSLHTLSELDRKKTIIDGLNNYIYGALGEHKVVKTIKALSDEYFLINDFNLHFSPAIYYSQEDEYIKSVQIDHLLVAPSGLFLIETKNWSEKSLQNLSLRSPVKQIRRANFVLFKLLNNEIRNRNYLSLDMHHWGDKKIPVKNLVVVTNTKPIEEFQYVKILTLNELLSYVNYFNPIFSSAEAKRITDYLININNRSF